MEIYEFFINYIILLLIKIYYFFVNYLFEFNYFIIILCLKLFVIKKCIE